MDFVNEGKLDEERKRRQAEWEKVRKSEDPIEAPPEVFDNRTLYDKLKEQHELKKREFEEQFALKNQIKGLDSDEAQFLSEIDRLRSEKERKARLEEKREIDEVKKAKVGALSSIASDVPKITLTLPSHKKENKQAELLSNIIKRKSSSNNGSATSASTLISSTDTSFNKITQSDSDGESDEEQKKKKKLKTNKPNQNKNQLVIGILPGIGDYDSNSSSQSDDSTDNEDDDNDDIDTKAILTRGSGTGSAAAKLT